MLKRRKTPWPPELGADNPMDRARTVARGYRALARKWLDWLDTEDPGAMTVAQARARFRAELDALDQMATRFGEDHWLLGQLDTTEPGARMTRAQVAARARVDPDTVTTWGRRGIAGVLLRRGPDGLYDPDEVDAFIDHRTTASSPNPGRTT